jgi:hypothetical protein
MPRPLLLVLALGGIVSRLLACDSATSETPAVEAGVEAEAGIDHVECPKDRPAAGTPCAVPEGTTCDVGACGTSIALCTHGRWTYGGNPEPDPPCPDLVPAPGEPCPECWKPGKSCPYPKSQTCTTEQRIATATCIEKAWSVTYTPCPDAGSHVQGDADADAD